MNCSLCGAVIPEGQTVCPNCGSPVQPMGGYQQPVQPMGGYQQPVQPMGGYQQQAQPMGGYQQQAQPMGGYQQPMGGYQQPMGGYQQPMGGYQQPMGGYQQPMGGGFNGLINAFKADVMKLVGLIGALLIFLTPLFNWVSLKMKYDGESEKEHMNMFGIAGDGDVGVFAFFGIMLMLIGIILFVWEIADYFAPIANIKMNVVAKLGPNTIYVELGLIALALLFVILGLANGEVNDVIEMGKDTIDMLKEWYDGVKGHCNHGLGPVVGFIGVIAAAAPRVLAMLHINVGRR